MSSMIQPNIVSFLADGAIPKGSAVKMGTDNKHVAICSAATDKQIGIAQVATTAAEDQIEVAVSGGGAKGLAGGTVSAGDLLASDSNGALVATTTGSDRVVGVAMEGASAGDLFSVQVALGII